ncbi:hypothetical protein [Brachybacterium sp. YJGR34]|uniref:hypothetical protein n=1 Tax=Brachybacterium sp. YJGR34 TaxID=2059911 RepID=UPI000E0A7D52|nr:hypothetical protein [Brachybacterium sp. YJGR34]
MRSRHSTLGEYSLALGLGAIVCSLIPVIGDAIAAPLAIAAVVLGVVGIHRYDAGRSSRVLLAALGTALGAIALFLIALMLIVTHSGS